MEEDADQIDPASLRYWTQFIRLLREVLPSRSAELTRQAEAARLNEPARQAVSTRLATG
jgi:hypothetical protein